MAMEAEDEAYPSFSTERLRSKLRAQAESGPLVQRRLDYNAPLLSVRSRLAEAGHGEVKTKVWKLSAELSKEPLREAGAIPFTWEHTPGRPKQPGSPAAPSSPSPPSTPSPPSVRRVSPASPPIPSPPLRPKFVRSQSSILFAPPAPPPPPPPPLPLHSPVPFFLPKKSAPPPPPSTSSQITDASTQGMRGFRLVEPTEGFLQLLLARRKKAEPDIFLSPDEPNNAEPLLSQIDNEMVSQVPPRNELSYGDEQIEPIPSHDDNEPILMVNDRGHVNNDAGAVGIAVFQRLLEDHDLNMISTNGMIQTEREEEDKDARLLIRLLDVPSADVNEDASAPALIKDREDNVIITQITFSDTEGTSENAPTVPIDMPMCSVTQQEVVQALEPKQALIKKDGHDRSSNKRMPSMAILNSCKAESMRMFRNAVVHLCRKAIAASLRSFAKAKRKVAPSFRRSVDVAVHCTSKAGSRHGGWDHEEGAAVPDVDAILQECVTSERTEYEQHQLFATISTAEQEQQHQPSAPTSTAGKEQHQTEHDEHVPFGLASSPEHEHYQTQQEEQLSSMAAQFPLPPPPPLSPPRPQTSSQECEQISSLKAGPKREFTSFPPPAPDITDSQDVSVPMPVKSPIMRPRGISAAHVYTRSMGADELNEFFDASSRFGSRSSTPGRGTSEFGRTSSYRGLSKDWGSESEFLDASSTPFETPRVSISDNKSVILDMDTNQFIQSPASSSTMSSSSKPASKLSKRVGKSLWVDTKQFRAMPGKRDALSTSGFKSSMSGQLHGIARQSTNVARQCQPGDQAGSSSLCQHKKNASDCTRNGTLSSRARRQASAFFEMTSCKSSRCKHVIEVSPVFPSKCQKNRSMASASGLPCRIAVEDTAEMGWPLGISGYPPAKMSTTTEAREEKSTQGVGDVIVPLPPLPASPAGGSWLRKALSSNTLNNHATLAGLQSMARPAKKPDGSPASVSESPVRKKRWEEIVKGSHNQPGHLRSSQEFHAQPLSNVNSNKYYVS